MKKRRGIQIKINFTNRWLYTLIAIGILALVGVGVYALAPGVVPNPGHNINEVSIPGGCTPGQFLKYDGANWVCSLTADYCAGGTCSGSLRINGGLSGVASMQTVIYSTGSSASYGTGSVMRPTNTGGMPSCSSANRGQMIVAQMGTYDYVCWCLSGGGGYWWQCLR